MQDKRLIGIYFISLTFFMLATNVFIQIMDPYREINSPLLAKTNPHRNLYLKKYERLQNYKTIKTLILGSSTSEHYATIDTNIFFGGPSFHASVPGSQTIGRLALLNQAIATHPELKTVIYIADFYEFNDNFQYFLDPMVVDNNKLVKKLPDYVKNWRKFNAKEYFWKFYSYIVLAEAFQQLKLMMLQSQHPIYSESGDILLAKNWQRQKIDSNLIEKLKGLATKSADKKINKYLASEIDESLIEYRDGVLKNFNYSQRTEKLFKTMAKNLSAKNINFIIILSPYHPLFKTKLLTSPGLRTSYHNWKNFMGSLSKQPSTYVVDRLDESRQFPKTSNYWTDGVHYSRDIANILLHQATKFQKK